MGKIVFENKGFQKSFEVAGLTDGLYFLQAYSGDGLETIKILVQSE
ncbi:MAG: T9SS type A sorting domain-containing protein [Saprospiraceae bacterium]|nr:T9SS type A sorting domain-containing protein [Saprospiraceae bacterium]